MRLTQTPYAVLSRDAAVAGVVSQGDQEGRWRGFGDTPVDEIAASVLSQIHLIFLNQYLSPLAHCVSSKSDAFYAHCGSPACTEVLWLLCFV